MKNKEKTKEAAGEMQSLSPGDYAKKLGISPQAVIKKIHNTLENGEAKGNDVKNCLPEGFVIKPFGRFYILDIPMSYVFPEPKEKKKKAKTTPAE
jgi:predicted transcriptional regulator